MENQIYDEYLKLFVEYQDKREFIFIPAESEIFQLKMMICAKFKLYEYNKLTILNKGNIISNYDDRIKICEVLMPENPNSSEFELIVIYDPELADKINNSYNIIKEKSMNYSVNQNNSYNLSGNINNQNVGFEYNSNPNSDNGCNLIKNSSNNMNFQLNLNLNSTQANVDNSLLREKSFLNESNVRFFVICTCAEGNEALNICLKCNCFVCNKCLRRDPHILHSGEIIKISNSFENMKNFLAENSNKLEENFLNDEHYIYLSNFEKFFEEFKNSIEKNYENILRNIEDIKEREIDYLIDFHNKINLEEKYIDLNRQIADIIGDFNSFNEADGNIQNHIIYRKNIFKKFETITSNHNIIKQYYSSYLNAVNEIDNYNQSLYNKVDEKKNIVESLFDSEGINKKLINLAIKEQTKTGTNLNDQVLLRLIDNSTIQAYKIGNGSLKNFTFFDRVNFKLVFNQNDFIQLTVENKLFILAGKKQNQFFYYNYEKNEIFKLNETSTSHFSGNLIYVPLNNTIYCLGGLNTKKCEMYKNDEILLMNPVQNIKMQNNKWENLPDMTCFRYDFCSVNISRYIYVFFGINNATKINNNTIERLNVLRNDSWELLNLNQNISVSITLNNSGILNLNDKEIFILGGNDGKNSRDSILLYNTTNNSVKLYDYKIPEFKKYMPFYFTKEPLFHKIYCSGVNNTKMPNYANIDSLNRLHLINTKRFEYKIINLEK